MTKHATSPATRPSQSGTTLAQLRRQLKGRIGQYATTQLIEQQTGLSQVAQYCQANTTINDDQLHGIHALAQRICQGEPLAYVIGTTTFMGTKFACQSDALIPRVDSETLVLCANRRLTQPQQTVVELGVGSGALLLTLARLKPENHYHGSDISPPALALAQRNAQTLGVCCQWWLGAWFTALAPTSRYHLIFANPPYLAADDGHLQGTSLPWEPATALVSGQQGYADLAHISQHAANFLQPNGWLLLEHGFQQGARCRQYLRTAGFQDVATHRDDNGLERVTEGRLAAVRQSPVNGNPDPALGIYH